MEGDWSSATGTDTPNQEDISSSSRKLCCSPPSAGSGLEAAELLEDLMKIED
jgi:hypothetical protein